MGWVSYWDVLMFTDAVDLKTGNEIQIIQMKLEGEIHLRELCKSSGELV